MASSIYFHEVTTNSSTDETVDLSDYKSISLTNLDSTNSIKLAFDSATASATDYATLVASETLSFSNPGVGSTLYAISLAGTPTLRITAEKRVF